MDTTEGHSWTDERERPNSWESLRSDFFGLRATESRTVSTFSGNLAVNFLPLVENCPFLVDLINVPVFLNFCNLELIWKVIEIKPLTVSCLDSLQGFCPQIEGYTKCFFSIDHAISLNDFETLFYYLSTLKNTE